jgi:hypothetical protein
VQEVDQRLIAARRVNECVQLLMEVSERLFDAKLFHYSDQALDLELELVKLARELLELPF